MFYQFLSEQHGEGQVFPPPYAEGGPFFDSETLTVPERGGLSPANVR